MILSDYIDYCFMADILISFRTTYQDPFTGEEVYQAKKIAKNYFYGRFWIDLISTIPVEKVVQAFDDMSHKGDNAHLKMISCIKLFRILRLSRLINYLN